MKKPLTKKTNKYLPLVYVCYPFRNSDINKVWENIQTACKIGDKIRKRGKFIPLVPHILISRTFGMQGANTYDTRIDNTIVKFNLSFLKKCDMMVVCGKNITKGMQEEIEFCQKYRIPIKYNEKYEE